MSSPRKFGIFETNSGDKSIIEEIEKSFQDIKNNPQAINQKLTELEYAIKSAQEGGCVRKARAGIMGPSPNLEHQYRLQQQVLQQMLVEFNENKKKSLPNAS